MNNIIQNIEKGYHSNIDKFSQSVIIAQLELLLPIQKDFTNVNSLHEK